MPRTSCPKPIRQAAFHHNGSADPKSTQTTAPPASSPASTSRLRTSKDASTLARLSTVRSRASPGPRSDT